MYYSVIKYGDTSEQVMLKFPTLHYIIITAFGGSKLTIGLYMKALHAVTVVPSVIGFFSSIFSLYSVSS